MPRSTKATTRTSIASKRTSKRTASKEGDIYAIPESPQSTDVSESADVSRCTSEVDATGVVRGSSPARSNRGRSMSIASTKVNEDPDSTPTQSRPARTRAVSLEPKQFQLPGLEALEAVNGLYQKLKDGQAEVERLTQENKNLIQEGQEHKKHVRKLQADLHTEEEKVRTILLAQDKDNQAACKTAEAKLETVMASLYSFRTAAFDLMPLLDVLTGAPEIEYDEATDRLYASMKQYKDRNIDPKSSDAKQGGSRSKDSQR